MKGSYHYVYVAWTDNLCYGRIRLGEASAREEARRIGVNAGKGCFIVVKERKYENHR